MEFTEQQLKNFKKYVRVQKEGKYNMLENGAIRATGLNRGDYFFVMENYSALKEASEKKGS